MTRILSLDDDTAILELIGLILERAGYEHVRTSDSHEALSILCSEPIDLFTQDIMRPDIDGWDFYRLIKSHEILHDIPVLILTCRAQSVDKIVGLQIAGVDGYLTKPFGPRELLTAIERVLEAHCRPKPTEEDRKRLQLRRQTMLQRRAQLTDEIAACLPNVRLEKQRRAAFIQGQRGCYEVSLDTGGVIYLPEQPVCIVPAHHQSYRPRLSLPFEDIDAATEQILSTIVMFSADQDIQDKTILQQLEERHTHEHQPA
ncbi:MAG: response regulator [Thermoflexales bacterium]|nr:response regulator [Thermoflexales bacterium]